MIDFHSHAFPGEVLDAMHRLYPEMVALQQRPEGPVHLIHSQTPLPGWDPTLRIREMGAAGIDLEVLSCPLVYLATGAHLSELCRLANDALADTCRRHPGRFLALAHIPFDGMRPALDELARCLDILGFGGVLLSSNFAGRYPDEPEFDPFWAEVDRRRVPVFLHPSLASNYRGDPLPALLSAPFDTTYAATRLLCRGLYDRFPGIVLVLAHMGGALPYLARRVDLGFEMNMFSRLGWQISGLPSRQMKNLYLDTAMSWSPGAFACAREVVGIDHLLFGTDYFMPGSRFMERTVGFLDSLEIAPAERDLLSSGNAIRILEPLNRR
jgi:predicted TIM-barrel fold metal-dependent hydrolase